MQAAPPEHLRQCALLFDNLSTEANLSARAIILEVKLWLNFFSLWLLRAQQQQEGNNVSSSSGMSLQKYTANYRPGMHTTALKALNVNADFF